MTVVLVADPSHAAKIAAAADLDPSIEIITSAPGEGLPAQASEATALVPRFLAVADALEVLDTLPALRLVQLMSNGADVWLPRVGGSLTICTASGAHGGSTAEWAMGALLAVLHDFPNFVAAQHRGEWDRHLTEELDGKRVLVLGAGDLGTQMRRRLEPFGAHITMAARTAREGVIAIDDVPAVLPEHDVVVLMVPLTEATHHLVDAQFLAALPDGAIVVNAARGPVVDTDALIAELTSGRLRAALDVTDPEPLPTGHPLWSAPGVFITPHVAGAVPGGQARALKVVVEQLNRFARGEELRNVVTDQGY